MRFVLRLCTLSSLCFASGLGAQTSESPLRPDSKLHPWLAERAAPGVEQDFLVVFEDRPDLRGAAALPTKELRGRFVYEQLRDAAERAQAPLRRELAERRIEFRSFVSVNALLVRGDLRLMNEIAKRPGVLRVEGNPVIRNPLPAPEEAEAHASEAPTAPCPAGVEWNICKTTAHDVWAMGFTGAGIVIGGQDTGYRWTHEALKAKYRGWNGTTASHDYNWHDAVHATGSTCGANSPVPCDDHMHGTHTMGTVLGAKDATTNRVGMAPGAQWIGCRNMNAGNGTPATYLECYDFFLAPTKVDGSAPDPSKAPDLTTNSWGCPTSEGCNWDTLESATNAHKAAGIMFVAAAGNSGPSCSTVDDAPANYSSAYTVGNTTSADALASTSSRGPGAGTNLMKPDISAPGTSIRSATKTSDTAYTSISGTSMATPNVAGCVALLWSARACYKRKPDETAALFNATARRLTAVVEGCGGNYTSGPNNSWGYGLLDCAAAVAAARTAPAQPAAPTRSESCAGPTLSWSPAELATRYTVLRGATCASLSPLATDVVALSYQDTSGTAGVDYCYAVRADADCGNSAVSATVTARKSAPLPMSNLGGAKSGIDLALTWATVPGAADYRIYRATAPTAAWGTPLATQTQTTFNDTGALANSTTFFYSATLRDACGQESPR